MRAILRQPWRCSTGGSDASGRVLAEIGSTRSGTTPAGSPRNWRDLRLRLLSAAVLAPVGLLCIWLGGVAFIALVLAAMVGLGF